MTTLYKWVRIDGSGSYGHGSYVGSYPRGRHPGPWMPRVPVRFRREPDRIEVTIVLEKV